MKTKNPEEVMIRKLYTDVRRDSKTQSLTVLSLGPQPELLYFFCALHLLTTPPSQILVLPSTLSAPHCVFSYLVTLSFLAFFSLFLCIC